MTRMTGIVRRAIRRLHDEDEGLTLTEMMVAILILGIALSAFAGLLLTTIRATGRNERTITATALAQEVVEEMQALTWDYAALYENEITSAPAAWSGRVSSGQFEGNDLVQLATYEAGSRVAAVPAPESSLTRNDLDFTIHRYVSWIDRDGNGAVDTRKFTAFVTWEDPFSGERELRFDSERAPTKDEVATTGDGLRVLYFIVSPDPATLSGSNPTADLKVTVRTNLATRDGFLQFEELDFDNSTDPVTLVRDTVFVGMTSSDPASDDGNGGWVTWTTTINKGVYEFWNGTVDFKFTATAANPARANDASGEIGVEFINGDYDEADVGGPAATPSATPTSPSGPPTISVQQLGTICVNAGGLQTQNIYMRAVAGNLPWDDIEGAANGSVKVTYSYSDTNTQGKVTGSYSSTTRFLVGTKETGNTSRWEDTIPAGSHFWKVGDVIDFLFVVTRDIDGQNAQVVVERTVTSC